VLILVIPNISPYVAAGIEPVDSLAAVHFKGMEATKELQEKEREDIEAIQQKYNVQRWWRHEKGWDEGIDVVARSHDRQRLATRGVVDTRQARIIEQTELAHVLGRISPFTSYARIVTTLAWTGPAFEYHLRRHMREYEDQLRRITTDGLHDGVGLRPELIPHFHYQPPPLARRFMDAIMDWVILLAGTVVFFLGAYVSFITREVI
jgi:hypothetical protein